MPQMWFGTRGYERWVKMPKPDVAIPYTKWMSSTQQLSGGISTQESAAGHKDYSFEWNGRIDEMRQISDILRGVYNTDEDRGSLIYFIDPSANTRNHFPMLWAAPYLCGLDAPSLTKTMRPTLTATPTNTFTLPARTATFTVGTDLLLTLYVPCPPGWEIRFALYGPSAVTGGYQTTPEGGSATARNVLANTTYGTGLTTISGVTGVEFSLTPSAGTVAITAGLLYVVPIGYPTLGPTTYQSGEGHSGCKVDGVPAWTTNTVADEINWANQSAHLVERGSWL